MYSFWIKILTLCNFSSVGILTQQKLLYLNGSERTSRGVVFISERLNEICVARLWKAREEDETEVSKIQLSILPTEAECLGSVPLFFFYYYYTRRIISVEEFTGLLPSASDPAVNYRTRERNTGVVDLPSSWWHRHWIILCSWFRLSGAFITITAISRRNTIIMKEHRMKALRVTTTNSITR
jgi:hypothetical protein